MTDTCGNTAPHKRHWIEKTLRASNPMVRGSVLCDGVAEPTCPGRAPFCPECVHGKPCELHKPSVPSRDDLAEPDGSTTAEDAAFQSFMRDHAFEEPQGTTWDYRMAFNAGAALRSDSGTQTFDDWWATQYQGPTNTVSEWGKGLARAAWDAAKGKR